MLGLRVESMRRRIAAAAAAVLTALAFFVEVPFHRLERTRFLQPPVTSGPTIRVLVLGDSIAHQYLGALADRVPQGTAIVGLREVRPQTFVGRFFAPATRLVNARDSEHMAANVRRWMRDARFDTIIVNVGLHDLKGDPRGPDELDAIATKYQTNLREILSVLQRHSHRVCFVSTTTSLPTAPPDLRSDRIARLNQIAEQVAASVGADFLDLPWPPILDSLYAADGYHLSAGGIDHVATSVATYLRSAFGNRDFLE